MIGEGWVWIGSDGVAASMLQADRSVAKPAEGLIAVSPKSKLFFNFCRTFKVFASDEHNIVFC